MEKINKCVQSWVTIGAFLKNLVFAEAFGKLSPRIRGVLASSLILQRRNKKASHASQLSPGRSPAFPYRRDNAHKLAVGEGEGDTGEQGHR